MATETEDEFLTKREADLIVANGVSRNAEQFAAHDEKHVAENAAIEKALLSEQLKQQAHNVSHDDAHTSHNEKHVAEGEAVKTALQAVDRERNIHSIAHDKEHVGHSTIHAQEQLAVHTALDAVGRERDIHATAHDKAHLAHEREHELSKLAISKAEDATDKRFTAVNGTRDTVNDIVHNLASKESVDAIARDTVRRWEENRKELDRRFDEQRVQITNIEKGDVKQEGRGIGQGTVITVIIGAVGFVGTLLGIIIVVANALSA